MGQENKGEGAGSGKKRVTWHSFPADACCDATARCPAAKLFPFAAPLLGAGDKTSGDGEASVVPLIVGHAVSHAPSRRPQMPFGRHLGGGREWRCS
jgi:hypothetical protein